MMRYKNLHDIDTFACNDGEVCLSVKDEEGEPFTIIIPAYEFIQWVDMDYIKGRTIKHIEGL